MNIKKIINSLPSHRLLFYLVILGLLPVLFAIFRYSKQKKEWEMVSDQLFNIHQMVANAHRKQYLNTIVRNVYCETDQFYLENQLQSLCFLKKEKEALEHLLTNPTFTGNEAAEKRYALLSSGANQFEWTQGSVQTTKDIQESVHVLAHPVEVDCHDLKEILTRIEGNRIGKPLLILADFKLNKKTHLSGNEVFELNIKLIKREFNS